MYRQSNDVKVTSGSEKVSSLYENVEINSKVNTLINKVKRILAEVFTEILNLYIKWFTIDLKVKEMYKQFFLMLIHYKYKVDEKLN